jgi:hypothetical protein
MATDRELLRRVVASIRGVYKGVGTPGDFGYDSREGAALRALYDINNEIVAAIGSDSQSAEACGPTSQPYLRKRPIAWMRYVSGGPQFQHASDEGDPPEDHGWIALYRRAQHG